MGDFITFPELLIWLPLIAGLLSFLMKSGRAAWTVSFLFSLLILGVSITTLFFTDVAHQYWNAVNYYYPNNIGNTFYVGLDGTSRILTLLTAVSFPLIFLSIANKEIEKGAAFYGLMMLAQCGLMGVFVSLDALLFYIFWELALIPVYFLCSKWGGEKRIQATFKFFVYTFAGSLLMLIGIIYVYLHTSPRLFENGTQSLHSFAYAAFANAGLSAADQNWLFWLFFIAFAIKMPVFPFHTWQPDTYDQSPTPVTMVLSGVMVKMGLFGVIRWLLPIFPEATGKYSHIIIVLSIIGIIYASLIAVVQDNIKKLVAYSSIAHIGLMCASIFALNTSSLEGMMLQMFNHGINIIGLWIVVEMIERQTGAKKLSELSGVAHKAPALTIFLVIIALANIALPLTNAFPGEFMMFTGLFKMNPWYAAVAGVGIILAAVYTLNMIQKVFYGEVNNTATMIKDINFSQKLSLAVIVCLIFLVGVYPQPLFNLAKESVSVLLAKMGM